MGLGEEKIEQGVPVQLGSLAGLLQVGQDVSDA